MDAQATFDSLTIYEQAAALAIKQYGPVDDGIKPEHIMALHAYLSTSKAMPSVQHVCAYLGKAYETLLLVQNEAN